MIKKLSSLANELDAAGEYAAADRIDSIIESLTKSAGNPDKRDPRWVATATEALKHFDAGLSLFSERNMEVTNDLPLSVEDLRRLVKANKPR